MGPGRSDWRWLSMGWAVLAPMGVIALSDSARAESPPSCDASWWKAIDVRTRVEALPSVPTIFLPAYWFGRGSPIEETLGLEVRDAGGRLVEGQIGTGLPDHPGISWWRPTAPLDPGEYRLSVDVPALSEPWNCDFPAFRRSVSFEVTGAPLVVPELEAHIILEKHPAFVLSYSDKCGLLDDETLCANEPGVCCRYADLGTYELRAGIALPTLPEGQGAYYEYVVEVDLLDLPGSSMTQRFHDRYPPFDIELTAPRLYSQSGELCVSATAIGVLTGTVVGRTRRCVGTREVVETEPPPPPTECDPAECSAVANPGPVPHADPSPERDAGPDGDASDGTIADEDAHTRSGDGGCEVSGSAWAWWAIAALVGRRRERGSAL